MPAPVSRTVDQVDLHHGITVPDPYRWLEDAVSEETRAWVEAQNAHTHGILRTLSGRDEWLGRLRSLWNYERFGIPTRVGANYLLTHNSGLQNQAVLLVSTEPSSGPGESGTRVLLDPNTLSDNGTVALAGASASPDGKYLAYALASAGSDWQEWRVRDIDTGEDLADRIAWAKFTGASWSADGAGFAYSRYDAPDENAAYQQVNVNHKLYFHRLGTPQDDDLLLHERPDQPHWNLGGEFSEDGRWLVVSTHEGTDPRNRLFLKDLAAGADAQVERFLADGDASYEILGNDGSTFWILTDKDAPNKRIVRVERDDTEPERWTTVVPEGDDAIQGASLMGDTFVVVLLHHARTVVRRFATDGSLLGDVELPGIGTATGFGGRRDAPETFFGFTSYTCPTSICRLDNTTGQTTVLRTPSVAFEPDRCQTTQVFVASKDGTRVPMFLTHRKGLDPTGDHPVYLYGYGGFNIPLTPGFSPAAVAWMEAGGIYAVANLRCGGEYGESWHLAGTRTNKQNVFDDFIACAEWLIAEGWTAPGRIAIAGGSNGGLLVGACMTQRPELYGAAVPAVGVLDMLRFSKFTIGWAWESDYGSVGNEDEFKALLAYSPYHNLKPGTRYPATLITTSDHDDRVVPAHSYKFAAALQAAQHPEAPPALIRVEVRAGHGAGKPVSKIVEEQADVFTFIGHALRGGFHAGEAGDA
ncbi:MAG: prolyl oligopeptidase family serine peptidase [Armatimonadota bacterium]